MHLRLARRVLKGAIMRASTFVSISLALVGCVSQAADDDSGDPADGKADGGTRREFSVSASTVEHLGGSLSGISPAVHTADAGHSPESYLDSSSCLGAEGPLGAWGPL